MWYVVLKRFSGVTKSSGLTSSASVTKILRNLSGEDILTANLDIYVRRMERENPDENILSSVKKLNWAKITDSQNFPRCRTVAKGANLTILWTFLKHFPVLATKWSGEVLLGPKCGFDGSLQFSVIESGWSSMWQRLRQKADIHLCLCREKAGCRERSATLQSSVQILHWTSSTTIWAQKKIAHKQGSTQGLHWASKCSTLRFQQSGVECRCFSEKAYFAIWRNTFCVEEYISF